MVKVEYDASLKQEYRNLFAGCTIRGRYLGAVDHAVAKIENGVARYQGLAETTGVPWYVIGCIHLEEANCDFTKHLHNGDSLFGRTVHVPAGRPPFPLLPPFTFEESAIDALKLTHFTDWKDWSIPGVLWRLESYNGLGYRQYHPTVKTPYLWSYTNVYTKGKYTADGHFSALTTSQQVGLAAILKRMTTTNRIQLA